MHESTLAHQLLGMVLERTQQQHITRVVSVRGWIAETEALSPEAIRFHFQALAQGTPAADAHLELSLIQVEALCRSCGARYLPDRQLLMCPQCGSSDATLLGRVGPGILELEIG